MFLSAVTSLMKNKLISIIVPIYNAEPYLHRCIDSILAQTYTELEIVLINDGSTDNSGHICEEYQKRDTRIKVVHQSNGGHSAARNAGLDNATGDYIGWVDSDDWIEPNMYEHLMSLMQETGSEIIQCSSIREHTAVPTVVDHSSGFDSFTIYGFDSIWEHRVKYLINHSLWGNLYKAELFDGLRFSSGHTAQDGIIFPEIIKRCNSFTKTNYTLYHYFQREDSTVHKEKTLAHLGGFEKIVDVYYELYKDYPKVRSATAFRLCIKLNDHKWYNKLAESKQIPKDVLNVHKPAMIIVYRACFRDSRTYVSYKNLSAKKKMYWWAFYLAPTIALRVMRAYEKGG